MDTWTLHIGYPIVTATRDYEKKILNLKQERFYINGIPEKNDTSLWWIPVTYISEGHKSASKLWMEAEEELDVALNAAGDEWLLVNVNQTGYYRVNYDDENWEMIVRELNSKRGTETFDPKNRAQLVDDAMNLANGGYLDYSTALNVTRYLVNEREYVPWKAAFNAFDFLYQIFSRSGQFDKYKVRKRQI